MAYRKIDSRIWNDKKFRALSDNGKLVFLMLLTHPNMTAIGAMRATMSGLSEEMGWSAEAFREAFREASQKGMAKHDSEAHFLYLPNFIKYNQPESPNVVKAWDKALDLLPECDLKDRVIAGAKAFLEGKSKAFREALPKAFAKSMPNQEQEQEQEQEQKREGGESPPPKTPRSLTDDFRMDLDWEPYPDYWQGNCQRAGINPDHSNFLHEFRLYWQARHDRINEQGWQGKLISHIKRQYEKTKIINSVDQPTMTPEERQRLVEECANL